MENDIKTVLSLFDGISCGQLAFQRAGINVQKYYASEIDKYAIQITQNNFPDTVQLGSIFDYNSWNIEQPDIILGGFPCFTAGTKVITDSGYKNIEDIKSGDMVLTHRRRYKKVLNVQKTKKEVWQLKASGVLATGTTAEHPYYIRTMQRVKDGNSKSLKRVFSSPEWKKVGTLKNNDYVGLPIIDIEENPRNLTEELCWFFGRYVADGYYSDSKRAGRINSWKYRIVICVGKHKAKEFEDNITSFHYTKSGGRTAFKYIINSKDLMILFKDMNFGRGAINKRVPSEILNLPQHLAKSFLDGYLSGDGSFNGNTCRATSISKELILGLNLLIAKVHSTNSTCVFHKSSPTTIIEGRLVNQNDIYTTDFRLPHSKYSHAVCLDGFIWLPIKKVLNTRIVQDVYNMEVAEDNSYTANNVCVHNCQPYSQSGKRRGLEDARGGNILDAMFAVITKYQPPDLFFENVLGLLSIDEGKTFKYILKTINDLGYAVDWFVINSALVSAQNRERVYILGRKIEYCDSYKTHVSNDNKKHNIKAWINKDTFMVFNSHIPQPEDKKIFLKDIIETGVTDREKSYSIDANYAKGGNEKSYLEHSKRQLIITGGAFRGRNGKQIIIPGNTELPFMLTEARSEIGKESRRKIKLETGKDSTKRDKDSKIYKPNTNGKANCILTSNADELSTVFVQRLEINETGKSNCLTSVQKDSLCVQIGTADINGNESIKRVYSVEGKSPCLTAICGGNQEPKIADNKITWRKLTPLECERLQTLKDNYSDCVSNSRRYHAIGNSWTVDVIAHIFNFYKRKDS